MGYLFLSLSVFILAYGLNMLYTSVFYHRALTHRALLLGPRTRRFVVLTGNWITGIDPKTWICMHRLHHRYSDTRRDPHSPRFCGILPILIIQLDSYAKTMRGLLRQDPQYTRIVRDLSFPVNWLNRQGLWFLPHLIHTLLALFVGMVFGAWMFALAYWVGIMSHPIQGWMVNALGHSIGYRNFATRDHSTNNLLVAFLVMGEGLQNNHHYQPRRANFSRRWWELDLGYLLCKLSACFGLLKFRSRSNKF